MFSTATQSVTIALIGKYTGLQDSYLSVIKSLWHACVACDVRLNLQWIEASLLEHLSDDENNTNKQQESDTTDYGSNTNNETELTAEEKYNDAWKKLKEAERRLIAVIKINRAIIPRPANLNSG